MKVPSAHNLSLVDASDVTETATGGSSTLRTSVLSVASGGSPSNNITDADEIGITGWFLQDADANQGASAVNKEPPILANDVVIGVLSAFLLVGVFAFILLGFVFSRCCKKSLDKRRMRNFQQRHGRQCKEDRIELCSRPEDCRYLVAEEDSSLFKKSSSKNGRGKSLMRNPIKEARNEYHVTVGSNGTERHPSPPRSVASLKSSANTVVENAAYDNYITTVQVETPSGQQGTEEERNKTPDERTRRDNDIEYMNLGQHLYRKKRREHAYETIECNGDGVKIVDQIKRPPSPIQIKRKSKSEDLTIFPIAPIRKEYEPLKDERTPPSPPSQNALPLPNKPSITSRSSMCVANRNQVIEPSPYLLRTWSAPDTALTEVRPQGRSERKERKKKQESKSKALTPPRLRLSKNKVKSRITEVIEGKGHLLAQSIKNNDSKSQRNRVTGVSSKVPRHGCQKPRMRRRAKRKVRKKRRVLDERRRQGIQLLRSRDEREKQGDDVGDGHNRWPLPEIYFDSSSGSGSDVMHFKSPFVRCCAHRDAEAREATLLEDIWCYLDEIAQKACRIPESYSSRRASDSLSSLSDDVIAPSSTEYAASDLCPISVARAVSHDSTLDRGYFTYKKYLERSGLKRIIERQGYPLTPTRGRHSVMTSSGLSTLTDTGTWMSSTATRCSSFSSSRNNSLFGYRPTLPRRFSTSDTRKFVIPEITFTAPVQPVVLPVTDAGDAAGYLEVLDVYLSEMRSVYETLASCATATSDGQNLTPDRQECVVYSHIKRDVARYAVISKRPPVQQASFASNESNLSTSLQPVLPSLENNVNPGVLQPNTETNLSETSDAVRNESTCDDVTAPRDVSPPKTHFLLEKTSDNYVVVAPNFGRLRSASCGELPSDVSRRRDALSGTFPQLQEDNTSMCVFMEMKV